jgi:hypothetical protein
MLIGTANIQNLVSHHTHKPGINIRRQQTTDHMPQMRHAVDIRQRRGNQDFRHCIFSPLINPFCRFNLHYFGDFSSKKTNFYNRYTPKNRFFINFTNNLLNEVPQPPLFADFHHLFPKKSILSLDLKYQILYLPPRHYIKKQII